MSLWMIDGLGSDYVQLSAATAKTIVALLWTHIRRHDVLPLSPTSHYWRTGGGSVTGLGWRRGWGVERVAVVSRVVVVVAAAYVVVGSKGEIGMIIARPL